MYMWILCVGDLVAMCHWVCAEQNKMVGFVLECLLLIITKVNSSPIMSCMVFVTLILQYMYNCL